MVDKFKGVIEIEIAGSKRGFKFGVRSMSLFCESVGITFGQSQEKLKEAESTGNMDIIMKFYHAGAVAYARLAKQPDPTIDDVYAWIEEVGLDIMSAKLTEVHKLPNENAPQTGQSS